MEPLRGKDQKRGERARSLRRALTPSEFALWSRIRSRQLGGFKFVRQEPIDRYYVDFVCRERRLIIELDGGQHLKSLEDRQRDGRLYALGYRVIRISPSPRPSPCKRGEGGNRCVRGNASRCGQHCPQRRVRVCSAGRAEGLLIHCRLQQLRSIQRPNALSMDIGRRALLFPTVMAPG